MQPYPLPSVFGFDEDEEYTFISYFAKTGKVILLLTTHDDLVVWEGGGDQTSHTAIQKNGMDNSATLFLQIIYASRKSTSGQRSCFFNMLDVVAIAAYIL